MSLRVGIVGLPNVGKSTLFNAMLRRQQALVANYPFATIEPNVGVVGVPDERLEKLADVIRTSEKIEPTFRIIPATVQFIDIAGLVKGAHKGEGLGNQFLAHIREVDLILHVVRDFFDPNIIKEGSVDPKSDFETVKTELELADLEMVEKQKDKKGSIDQNLPLFSKKPVLLVYNTDEEHVSQSFGEGTLTICAKMEAELASLDEEESREYLTSTGLSEPGLNRVIRRSYEMLGLISFFTAGPKEVRAWTVTKGTKAPQAAGVIHSDFEKLFIRAQVIGWKELVEAGSTRNVRERGLLRTEGKEYIIQDGDVAEFLIGQ